MTEMSGNDRAGLHLAQMRQSGELQLPFEPRCRVCRNPDLRKRRSTSCSHAGSPSRRSWRTWNRINAALRAAEKLQSLLDRRSEGPDVSEMMVQVDRIINAMKSTVLQEM